MRLSLASTLYELVETGRRQLTTGLRMQMKQLTMDWRTFDSRVLLEEVETEAAAAAKTK